MCVNTKYVYNRYIRKNILVDCGKCPSCLQKKAAHRANRIRNNLSSDKICLFVTLTYKNKYIPFVFKKDIELQKDSLPVYRDGYIRKVRVSGKKDYDFKFVSYDRLTKLDEYWVRDLWFDVTNDLAPSLKRKKHCVGVCFYKDLQDFYKRLRVNLQRKYHFYDKFTSFSCSEYGGSSYRPHFHALIFIPKYAENLFRDAIVESWPFADRERTRQFIEVARDCASYVSSYVNGGSIVSSCLAFPCFKSKHSYSKNFGLAVDCFNLSVLLEKVRNGDMRYYSYKVTGSESTLSYFPIPQYVINRYFPKFKGFSRLSPYEIRDLVLRPERLYEYRTRLDYTDEDIYKITVRLNNAYKVFNTVTGLNRFDYSYYFPQIWTCYKSVVLRDSYDEVRKNIHWLSFYENIGDLNADLVHAPTLTALFSLDLFVEDPNKVQYRQDQEKRLVPLYYKLCKQKKVTNEIMSQMGLDV